MSINELGNLGEFVGSLGVIISMLILAYQIRANTVLIRRQGREANLEAQYRVFSRLIDHPELAAIVEDPAASIGNLEPGEALRLRLVVADWFITLQVAFFRAEELRDNYPKEQVISQMLQLLAKPIVKEYWDQFESSGMMRPEFQKAVREATQHEN